MLWNAEHGRYGLFLCARLWSEQCWVPCSFSAYEWLSVCRKFCGVHSWQNGTRCRNGVKVLWCHWFPSSLVAFLGFHPYTCLFSFRKHFLWLVSVLFFCFWFFGLSFRNCKKGGRRCPWESTVPSDGLHILLSALSCCPMGQVGLSMGLHCPTWGPPYPTVRPIPPYHEVGGIIDHCPVWTTFCSIPVPLRSKYMYVKWQ